MDIEVVEKTVEEEKIEETKPEEEKKEETKSVLPNTGDVAVVAFIALMVISLVCIALVVKRKITK